MSGGGVSRQELHPLFLLPFQGDQQEKERGERKFLNGEARCYVIRAASSPPQEAKEPGGDAVR